MWWRERGEVRVERPEDDLKFYFTPLLKLHPGGNKVRQDD